MREIIIKENEAEQRLDKLLKKYLNEAPQSFLYKMLRKKNITLNGKKADGSEKVHKGDSVKLFLADDTIEKFQSAAPIPRVQKKTLGYSQKKTVDNDSADMMAGMMPDIIYEDNHIILINKPVGMLSQKADKDDVSVVEYITMYLLESGQLKEEELRTFKPSICNRLDRNTSGIIVAGKSLSGLQTFGEMFKNRTLRKYYLALVKGKIDQKASIQGYLVRDMRTHKVQIMDTRGKDKDAVYIETEYTPVAWNQECTLLNIHLVTGRTHQIRAHLSSVSHPVIGDYKYGERRVNDSYKKRYALSSQFLHAYRLELPELDGGFDGEYAHLSGRAFDAPLPELFQKIIEETAWEHGTQEALEVLH